METSNDACSAESPGAIESAFGGLRTEMDELDKRVAVLLERISPVLGPSLPGNDQCAKEEGGGSDIAQRVRRIQGEVQSHINVINDVINRLEL